MQPTRGINTYFCTIFLSGRMKVRNVKYRLSGWGEGQKVVIIYEEEKALEVSSMDIILERMEPG